MENVYDVMSDFYEHDENWNVLLKREYAEGFIRNEAWQGETDKGLQKKWEYIMMLCLYLGYAERFLGDLGEDGFIDAVAWCGRNITDFKVNEKTVKEFLDTSKLLLEYLQKKNIVRNALAPYKATERLLGDDGALRIIQENGEFFPANRRYVQNTTPNAPVKIFLNLGDMLQSLLDELHEYFQQEKFSLDLERALFLYHGILEGDELEEETESDEFWQSFWDYFLFDYHLLEDDKSPLEHFNEHKITGNQELVEELLKSKLAIFTVDGITEDELYLCTDFLTGEQYSLNLPIEGDLDIRDKIFVGHCFYNNTMVMNYIRCLKVSKLAAKCLKNAFNRCFDRYKIQEPQSDWAGFITRHPMIIRNLAYIYSSFVKLDGPSYETAVKDYLPLTENKSEDEVIQCLKKMMISYHFSKRDIDLASRIWQDYLADEVKTFRKPEVWAAGVIENFIQLNAVYNYTDAKIAEMCWNVPLTSLKIASEKIKNKLLIEKHDPRYSNEEGLLLMMFSS